MTQGARAGESSRRGVDWPDFGVSPYRVWRHRDVPCAIIRGPLSYNGYVRLPDVVDELARRDDDGRLQIESVEVHGGLTYGPDADGWIGFDTAHAFDTWVPEHPDDEPPMLRHLRELGLPAPPMGPRPGFPGWGRIWTVEKLEVEVERLAEQVATRQLDRR